MDNTTLVGIDLGKHSFHLHCRNGGLRRFASYGQEACRIRA